MKFKDVLKSPIFAQGHNWGFAKRAKYYESDVTALVRKMLENESIAQDQRFAWERWRAEDRLTKR